MKGARGVNGSLAGVRSAPPRPGVGAVRIGVVGAGHMGRRHARKVAELSAEGGGVTLAGVADLALERARAVAGPLAAPALADAGRLFASADAVVVAVPSRAHHAVVSRALRAGLDVLVEKPIAPTLREAEELLALSERLGRVLCVGHLEWFNAATRAARERVRAPHFVSVQRIGPFAGRGADVDVVRDLMIHDIEILQQILGEDPSAVEAVGGRVLTDWIDVAEARLRFPSGCVASLTASRVSEKPKRRMRFFARDECLSVDFLAPSASVHRPRRGGAAGVGLAVDRIGLAGEDPLLAQLRAFVAGVRSRARPAASGASALGALRTALRVIDAMPSLEAAG